MYSHQNLTDGRLPLWRHGRAWWWKLNWEWLIGINWRTAGVAVGRFGGHISLPGFSFYLTYRDAAGLPVPAWRLYWFGGAFRFETPWQRQMEWRSDDPWWKKGVSWTPADTFLGRWKCTVEKESLGSVWVPMPEGCYEAVATLEKRVWRRRFGITKRRNDVRLNLKNGIPHAGKGTCAYNCGDVAVCGTGGASIEDAIANAVRSALINRRRYGYDSKGTGREPSVSCTQTDQNQVEGDWMNGVEYRAFLDFPFPNCKHCGKRMNYWVPRLAREDHAHDGCAAIAENTLLRKLLWLRHGCGFNELYGDDGEMQCQCGLDFKRMTATEIWEVWHQRGLAKMEESQVEGDGTP